MKATMSVTRSLPATMTTPFWRLWSASTLSNLGDGIYQFVLPLLAIELTRAPSLVSSVTIALTLAWPVFGLHGGGIVDRFDRQTVLASVAVLRVGVLASLTIATASGSLGLPMIYFAAVLLGIGEVLADTALTSLIPSVVERDGLERANGRITAGQTITNTFVGPPIAGALFGIAGAVATGVATVVYGLAAVFLGLLRVPTRTNPVVPRSGGRDGRRLGVTAGLRFLWSSPTLRMLTLFTAAMNIWWAAWAALFVLLAVAPGPIGLSTAGYGVLLSAVAVGGVLGSLGADRVRRVLGVRNALLLDIVGTAMLVGAPAFSQDPVVVAIATVGAAFGSAVWVVLVASIRQRLTPDEVLGRVYSASRLISWGVLPVGAAGAGLAAEVVGVPAVFAIGAAVSLVLVAAFALLIRNADLLDASREGRP